MKREYRVVLKDNGQVSEFRRSINKEQMKEQAKKVEKWFRCCIKELRKTEDNKQFKTKENKILEALNRKVQDCWIFFFNEVLEELGIDYLDDEKFCEIIAEFLAENQDYWIVRWEDTENYFDSTLITHKAFKDFLYALANSKELK